jgi:hypothetical protein
MGISIRNMDSITRIFALILLFLPSIGQGSTDVLNRQAGADKPGVSKIARGMTISFDNDGEWYLFAGFKSKMGCPEGFETITVFQYNRNNIISVKPGVYSVWTRTIKSKNCSFNVNDMNFTDGDETGQWFGVIYNGMDLGISPENHVVACTEEVADESFDGFLQRAICPDAEE